MYKLLTSATPNGWKASCTLEELGIPYELTVIDLQKGDQKKPDFLALNPNGRIPVIVDTVNGDFPVFESGAIMLYLAEKHGVGKIIPADAKGRSEVTQWLMFQMGGIGPMMGQANVFYRYFPEKLEAAISRYQNESRRLFEVLNTQLGDGRDYLVGDFSIADIANWCWVRIHNWSGVSTEGLDPLIAWMARMEERPACAKGVNIPERKEPQSDEEREQRQKAMEKSGASLITK